MKTTKVALFIIASSLFLSACSLLQPAATTTTNTTPVTPTQIVTATPTPASTDVNDLNAELNATVDDGGKADLNQLQNDATGL